MKRIDWILCTFHIAGVDWLHHFLPDLNELIQADKYIAEEVSHQAITGLL